MATGMSDVKPSIVDRTLTRLGNELQDETARKKLITKIARGFRLLFTIFGLGYTILLLAAAGLMRMVGENNVSLAFFLYLPQIIWLSPLPVLLLPALIWQRKLFIVLMATALFFTWSVLGYRFGPEVPLADSSRDDDTLTVLTYNRGQNASQSLQPFKNLIKPDLLALQEAGGRAPGYAKAEDYEEFPYAAGQDQFVLLSKYPIIDTIAVTLPFGDHEETVAARFEIDWNGTPIAVYNVHLPTPRDILAYYRRGAFVYGIIGVPGTPWSEKRKKNQAYWDSRLDLSRALVAHLKEEKLPMIVVGDFNAPHAGYNHRLFNSFLQDSHKKSGGGFGYTFPGITRNPLSLYGPWMRIDYVFCDDNWSSLRCTTEKKRPSQHRALAATLKLKVKD